MNPLAPLASLAAATTLMCASAWAEVEYSKTETPLKVALPLASISEDGEGCFAQAELKDTGAKSYADHLASRFDTDITLCLTSSQEELEALLLQDAAVNLAWVNQETFENVSDSWRSLLTLRAMNGLGRPPAILFTHIENEVAASDVPPEQIGYISKEPSVLHIDIVQRVLTDAGLSVSAPTDDQLFSGVDTLLEAVKTKAVPYGLVEASGWGRECAVLEAGNDPCGDLNVILNERPLAIEALALHLSADKERQFRLVGVHIGLHLEAPEAFAWLTQGKGSELEPTESTALIRQTSYEQPE